MTNILRLGLFVLVLSAHAACADSPVTPTSPTGGSGSLALTAEQLAGTWALSSLQVAGRAAQPVPAGADYSLAFAGGRVSARADCNSCGGGFTVSGLTMTLGPDFACTRALCPTAGFETAYMGLLSGEATVTLSGHTLVLTSPRGTLQFSR